MNSTIMMQSWPWLTGKDKLTCAMVSPGYLNLLRQQEFVEAEIRGEALPSHVGSVSGQPPSTGRTEISEAEVLYLQEWQIQNALAERMEEEETLRSQREWFLNSGGKDWFSDLPFQSDSE